MPASGKNVVDRGGALINNLKLGRAYLPDNLEVKKIIVIMPMVYYCTVYDYPYRLQGRHLSEQSCSWLPKMHQISTVKR